MDTTARRPEDEAPNAGQDVSDATEPAEEYELDQLTDERAATAGESLTQHEEAQPEVDQG
jgi:hypothetical protein